MSMPEGHALAMASELSLDQLTFIAKTHLDAPLEWGDKSYDNPELRQKIAEGWQRLAKGNNLFLGAVLEGAEVKAFLWADRILEPSNHLHIQSLWVDGSLRRRGIARMLKEAVESWGRETGAGWVKTEVHSNNAGMLRLNAEMGFESTYIQQRKTLSSPS